MSDHGHHDESTTLTMRTASRLDVWVARLGGLLGQLPAWAKVMSAVIFFVGVLLATSQAIEQARHIWTRFATTDSLAVRAVGSLDEHLTDFTEYTGRADELHNHLLADDSAEHRFRTMTIEYLSWSVCEREREREELWCEEHPVTCERPRVCGEPPVDPNAGGAP